MKELLLRYADYNLWANRRLLAILGALPEEQLDRDLGSSHISLRGTVYHIWDAETVWYERLHLAAHVVLPSRGFTGNWEDFMQQFIRQSELLRDFIATASEAKLGHTIEYNYMKGGVRKSGVEDVILSVFNHSTYHRGQLVTMLRQTGVTKIPQTDFIEYTRVVKK